MKICRLLFLFALLVFATAIAPAQTTAAAKLGSETAKNGFRNETEIAAKFNDWKNDADAQAWLRTMGYEASAIKSIAATKPHGEKADVMVKVTTAKGDTDEGISIKLVSSDRGFNQIDKRWLSHYVRMWQMPDDVVAALKLFLGEVPPVGKSRRPERMYLNEIDADMSRAVVDFFEKNRAEIVSDLFEGDGLQKAKWIMVAQKSNGTKRWVLRRIDEAAAFFSEGKVEITRNGNLRIGKITVQRKGGDGGRESAKMMQFKINPALLFDAK
jgi:hypothetical protein